MGRRKADPIAMDPVANDMLHDALAVIARDVLSNHVSDERCISAEYGQIGVELKCMITWKRVPIGLREGLEINVGN